MPDSLIPYDEIAQEALRAVVGRVLSQIEGHDSLPGEHHFYITFKTQAPGVDIPAHLVAKFPDEMTIVLQHQFWDLKVDREARQVSVGLSFGGTPSTLVIPFDALTGFLDPHVRVGLRFGELGAAEAAMEAGGASPEPDGPPAEAPEPPAPKPETPAQVVSLDAFRRRPTRE